MTVKKLRNTNFISSRHVKRENTSFPVDVRRSKTSLLKLPNANSLHFGWSVTGGSTVKLKSRFTTTMRCVKWTNESFLLDLATYIFSRNYCARPH